jgi:hypothetical protein
LIIRRVLPLLVLSAMLPCRPGFCRLFSMYVPDWDLGAFPMPGGQAESGSPFLTLLRVLIVHHAATIPFENLDLMPRLPIPADNGMAGRCRSPLRAGHVIVIDWPTVSAA